MPLAHLSIDLTYGRLPPGINFKLNVPTIISYVILTAQQTRGRISRRVVLVFALAHQISVICTLYISIAQPTPRAIMAEQMQGVLPASAIQSSVSPELAVMAPAPVNPSATPAAENIQSPASAPPEQVSETLYIQNLNERVKLDGKTSLILLILPASSRR